MTISDITEKDIEDIFDKTFKYKKLLLQKITDMDMGSKSDNLEKVESTSSEATSSEAPNDNTLMYILGGSALFIAIVAIIFLFI